MSLTELPYGLAGRIFGSPMPYSSYDPSGMLVERYEKEGISAIVLLAGEEEYLKFARRDLKQLYTEQGFEILHLPITDFGIPDPKDLRLAVNSAYDLAKEGKNVAIHCHAGIGRTGTFAACLARQALGLTGEGAISWVRELIPHAVETGQQRNVVLNFQPREG